MCGLSFHYTPSAMQVQVNGKPTELDEGTTVAELVHAMGLAARRIAVELNGEILPRSRHAIQRIAPGDVLEIVHAIGGGTPAR